MDNTSKNGDLNNKKVARATLQYYIISQFRKLDLAQHKFYFIDSLETTFQQTQNIVCSINNKSYQQNNENNICNNDIKK